MRARVENFSPERILLHGQVRRLPVRVDGDLAELVLGRNQRNILPGQGIEILLHVVGRQFRDVRGDLGLLLLDQALVLHGLAPLLAKAVQRLAEVFLDGLVAAQPRPEHVHLLGQFALDHVHVHAQRVHARLHQEDLGFHHVLQHFAAGVPVGSHALGAHHLHLPFDVGDGDRFGADDGDGLVDQAVPIFLGRSQQGQAEGGGQRRGFENPDSHMQFPFEFNAFRSDGPWPSPASPVPNPSEMQRYAFFGNSCARAGAGRRRRREVLQKRNKWRILRNTAKTA